LRMFAFGPKRALVSRTIPDVPLSGLPHLRFLVAGSTTPRPDACAALLQSRELALAPGT
jgi:hypothetical protein